jgi:hypothetical protein
MVLGPFAETKGPRSPGRNPGKRIFFDNQNIKIKKIDMAKV